jgi:hypothetical protein
LYTLSDHIDVPHQEHLRSRHIQAGDPALLLEEVSHLAKILIVADKYCVRDLATLASRKISTQLPYLKNYAYSFNRDKSLQALKLLCAFSEALCLEHDTPPFQKHQDAFLAIIWGSFDICTVVADIDVELTRRHPKFVHELLWQSAKALKSERETVQRVVAELPIAKRRKLGM